VAERKAGDTAHVLRDLQWNWGEAYLITGAAGHWIAHRRDNGQMLAASSPDELRELIIEDYAGQQVLRGTERPARA
jgi:hypothetical protein